MQSKPGDIVIESAKLKSAPEDVLKDVERGVKILKSGGCKEIYILGSVAEDHIRPESDIDFAVRGCPPEHFFKLQGRLLMELNRSADLVDLDVDPELTNFLEQEATLIHVG